MGSIEIDDYPKAKPADRSQEAASDQPDPNGSAPAGSETRARLSAYFRLVGLTDEAALEKATHAVLTRVTGVRADDDETERAQRALKTAMSMVDEWMRDLVKFTPTGASHSGAAELLPYYLRRLLQEHPESFLNRAELPACFADAVELAAVPALPPRGPERMLPQKLGSLPRLVRPAYWHRLRRRLGTLLKRRGSPTSRESCP